MLDALISIKPKYVDKLIAGEKSVEIRSRPLKLPSGTRLWIYSTLPRGCIQTVAQVEAVERCAPLEVWDKHQRAIGVSREKFDHYANGSKEVSAIILSQVWNLPCNISLKSLKKDIVGFHPPQFLKYMNNGDPLLSYIKFCIRSCKKDGSTIESGLSAFIEQTRGRPKYRH